MKTARSLLAAIGLTVGTLVASAATAGHDPATHKHDKSDKKTAPAGKGQLVAVTEKDAAWAANARKVYPLDVCLTSDEKLGSMGKSPEYIYRAEGKPDRLVVFCCSGCEDDFMKEPAKYLAKLDEAAKKKASTK